MRNVPFGRPIIGAEEKAAVAEVLEGHILVHGPRAKQFEADFAAFTGSPYAVSVSSCTAALHLSYFYLGTGPGDEVIVPAQTHNATAHAVELTGAMPVFVDAELRTGNMDLEQLEAAITPNTKAISLVHYLGLPVDMPKLMTIANKHNLFVVEDCALAIGGYVDGKHVGLFGDVGAYSFYPVKHMTTAEGGMLTTKHEDIATKITRQRAFGVDRHVGERKVPGVYDVNMLGFNYRLNEIASAIGIEQVKRMPDFLTARKANYEVLQAGLQDIVEIDLFESSNDRIQSSYYCLSVVLKDAIAPFRFEIVNYLKEHGVGTSVYYPKAVPKLTYYREKYGYQDPDYPNATRISEQSIALPVGPHLDQDDMAYIVATLKDALAEVTK